MLKDKRKDNASRGMDAAPSTPQIHPTPDDPTKAKSSHDLSSPIHTNNNNNNHNHNHTDAHVCLIATEL